MKTIDYYMGLPYKLEIVPDVEEGGYVARYPDLPGCISVGSTLEEAVNPPGEYCPEPGNKKNRQYPELRGAA